MKQILLFFSLSICSLSLAQEEQDTLKVTAQDSAILYSMELKEVVLTKPVGLTEAQKKLLILKRRVYKTYPYAKLTAEKLVKLNETMAKLKTKKEKKKYLKIVEKYLTEEFEPKLKKLSRKDGQILVKLIYRQTGQTTYDLIKDYKSGWKAFWSNNTAKLFDIDLKEDFEPYDNLEDFQIETILASAFRQGHLVPQESTKPVDVNELLAAWREKVAKMREEQDNKEKESTK